MTRSAKSPEREERITMEIVVDAYDEMERAMGWYCYLEENLRIPFKAKWRRARGASSKQSVERVVEVLQLADADECEHEMRVTISIDHDKREVPLDELQPIGVDAATQQAVDDWCYWVKQGYMF